MEMLLYLRQEFGVPVPDSVPVNLGRMKISRHEKITNYLIERQGPLRQRLSRQAWMAYVIFRKGSTLSGIGTKCLHLLRYYQTACGARRLWQVPAVVFINAFRRVYLTLVNAIRMEKQR
jgi:hypothetical protein